MTHRNLALRTVDVPLRRLDPERPRIVERVRLVDELGRVVVDDLLPWFVALVANGRDDT